MTGLDSLREIFGEQVQENVVLAPYTSARIGGPADILLTVKNIAELTAAVNYCWQAELSFYLFGGGSNLLVSDQGIRGIVILNRAKEVRFREGAEPSLWAESGAVFSNLANRTATKNLSGLEWAATVPGTVGGAVYGNAGAFGSDVSENLIKAQLLTRDGEAWWPAERLNYAYRSSILKRAEVEAVVLSAEFKLKNGNVTEIKHTINQFTQRRKASQPPGASMGSMFKNPPTDFAGRLIEAAGLKGTRIGNAEISRLHGNFFINHGETSAQDIRSLIKLTQTTVFEKLGVHLELEVELAGEWA